MFGFYEKNVSVPMVPVVTDVTADHRTAVILHCTRRADPDLLTDLVLVGKYKFIKLGGSGNNIQLNTVKLI